MSSVWLTIGLLIVASGLFIHSRRSIKRLGEATEKIEQLERMIDEFRTIEEMDSFARPTLDESIELFTEEPTKPAA